MTKTPAVNPLLAGIDPAIWIVLGLVAACAGMFALMKWTGNTLASTHEVNTDRKAAARLYLVLHDLAEDYPAFVAQASALREGRTARQWATEVEHLAKNAGLAEDDLADILDECRSGLWSDASLLDRNTARPD